MSLILPEHRDDPRVPGGPCDACGLTIPRSEPAILTHGRTAILFHVACAEVVALQLFRAMRKRKELLASGSVVPGVIVADADPWKLDFIVGQSVEWIGESRFDDDGDDDDDDDQDDDDDAVGVNDR